MGNAKKLIPNCLILSLVILVTKAVRIFKSFRMSLCFYVWFGLAFQLLPVLSLIIFHNSPLKRSGFDLNMCYFYSDFNRKLFIQHINHKMLQTSDFIMQPSSNYTQL